jgi:diguanylate cyclase (GGDEF)-like protein
MRAGSLLLAALLSLATVASGAEHGSTKVELLDTDTPTSERPGASVPSLSVQHGDSVEVVLPYREQGTWVRITPETFPPDARLVVYGVAVGRITLVLPDGRAISRAKTEPSDDSDASSVASVFTVPQDLALGASLLLHFDDHHRNLVDIRLMSAVDWREHERLILAFSLAVYGAMFAFIVIAGTYWTILRERMFADHALYLLCLLTFMAVTSGLFYVPFHDGFWSRAGIQAQWGVATLAIAFAVGFSTRFLDVARTAPGVARALEILRMALIVSGVAAALSPISTPHFGAVMSIILVAVNFVLVGLAIHAAFQKNRYAGYFLLGWIPLTASTTMRALQASGVIEIEYEMSFLSLLGALWEALVLTAGIADRALSFRRERDVAKHLAEHDGLTGVLNRRAAQSRLDEAFSESRRFTSALAVFFLDIDHFKAINDTHGHAAGDAVLIAVSKRIVSQLRASDVVGRWGGEEFVAILPGASAEIARAMGERIRRAIEAEPIRVEDAAIRVTVSVGVAMLDARNRDSADLVQLADEALYRAKKMGRNRVEEAAAA